MTSVLPRFILALTCLLAVGGSLSSVAAQDSSPIWQTAVIWAPALPEAGETVAEYVNRIDAACTLDVDGIQSTNGAGPEGAVYAFLVSWSCPAANAGPTGLTWQSTMIWAPNLADAGTGLAEQLNQMDASCRVDVDPIQSTNGAGPEGPVYAFVVAWAC